MEDSSICAEEDSTEAGDHEPDEFISQEDSEDYSQIATQAAAMEHALRAPASPNSVAARLNMLEAEAVASGVGVGLASAALSTGTQAPCSSGDTT